MNGEQSRGPDESLPMHKMICICSFCARLKALFCLMWSISGYNMGKCTLEYVHLCSQIRVFTVCLKPWIPGYLQWPEVSDQTMYLWGLIRVILAHIIRYISNILASDKFDIQIVILFLPSELLMSTHNLCLHVKIKNINTFWLNKVLSGLMGSGFGWFAYNMVHLTTCFCR